MTLPLNTLMLDELLRQAEDSNDPLARELARRINRLTETIPKYAESLKKNLRFKATWGELETSIEEGLADALPDIVQKMFAGSQFSTARRAAEETIKDMTAEEYKDAISEILNGQ